jgi:hypothetical protein
LKEKRINKVREKVVSFILSKVSTELFRCQHSLGERKSCHEMRLLRGGLLRDIMRVDRREVRFSVEPRSPTRFLLREVFRSPIRSPHFVVSVGFSQRCNCPSRDICVHIIYVMMRVFGVPHDSDLLWHGHLTVHQLSSLLDGRVAGLRVRERVPAPCAPNRERVHRLQITSDDHCPICYDRLVDGDPSRIAWCSFGCGGNFHLECVQAWIDSQAADGAAGSCPFCRAVIIVPDTEGDVAVAREREEESKAVLPRMIDEAVIRKAEEETGDDNAVATIESAVVNTEQRMWGRTENICDALSLAQVRFESQRVRLSLSGQVAFRIAKRHRLQIVERAASRFAPRPIAA